MANIMGVGEAKKRFSQLMSQVVYDGQRFIIQRRGKPMVALVKAEDIARMEEITPPRQGLLAAVGAWDEFENLDTIVEEIYRAREEAQERQIMLEG